MYYDPWQSLTCSFHLFLLIIVFILLCIPDFSFIKYLSSQCHVCFHILNIELELDSHSSCSTWLFLCISSNTFPVHSMLLIPLNSSTLHFHLTHLHARTWNCSSTPPPIRNLPETQFTTSIQNTLDTIEGRRSAPAEADSRKPLHFHTSDFQRSSSLCYS